MSLSDVFFDDPTYEEPTIALQGEDAEAGGDAGAEGDADLNEAQEEYIEEKAEEVFDDLSDKGANVAVEQWSRVKELSGLAMADPMSAHLAMAGMGLAWAWSGFAEAFRYRAELTINSVVTDYYKGGVVDGSTNWWKQADTIRNWSALIIGGTLGLTSLMAAFGIANGLNAMLWYWLTMAGGLVDMTVGLMRWWGYDTYYAKAPKSTDTNYAAAVGAMAAIKGDALYDMAMSTGSVLTLYGAYEGFAYDAWMLMSAEDKAKSFEDWEKTISERAAKVADAREEAGLTGGKGKKEEKEEDDAEEGAEEGEGEGAEEGADEGEEATED